MKDWWQRLDRAFSQMFPLKKDKVKKEEKNEEKTPPIEQVAK